MVEHLSRVLFSVDLELLSAIILFCRRLSRLGNQRPIRSGFARAEGGGSTRWKDIWDEEREEENTLMYCNGQGENSCFEPQRRISCIRIVQASKIEQK